MPVSRRRGQTQPASLHEASSQDSQDDWYSIKRILDERKVGKHTEYLVDWENHPTTGEQYSPSWVRTPERDSHLVANVLETNITAIRADTSQKKRRRSGRTGRTQPARLSRQVHSPTRARRASRYLLYSDNANDRRCTIQIAQHP